MRITPMICWECSNWFLPKTKRRNKYCCNACRQGAYNTRKNGSASTGYECLVNFRWYEEEERLEIKNTMEKPCTHETHTSCVECLFENDYRAYSMLVYKYGRDHMGRSMKTWLNEVPNNESEQLL